LFEDFYGGHVGVAFGSYMTHITIEDVLNACIIHSKTDSLEIPFKVHDEQKKKPHKIIEEKLKEDLSVANRNFYILRSIDA